MVVQSLLDSQYMYQILCQSSKFNRIIILVACCIRSVFRYDTPCDSNYDTNGTPGVLIKTDPLSCQLDLDNIVVCFYIN